MASWTLVNIDSGKLWHAALWPQDITWANVDLSLVGSFSIPLKALIALEMLMKVITTMKISCHNAFKTHTFVIKATSPGDNELICYLLSIVCNFAH